MNNAERVLLHEARQKIYEMTLYAEGEKTADDTMYWQGRADGLRIVMAILYDMPAFGLVSRANESLLSEQDIEIINGILSVQQSAKMERDDDQDN